MAATSPHGSVWCSSLLEYLGLLVNGEWQRIALPRAKVRLSAGRTRLTREGQALCFFAGANSIFYGDKLLTAKNPGADHDRKLMEDLDLLPQAPFQDCAAAMP